MPRTIVVLSGGMDSTVLLAHQLDRGGHLVTALSVDYGQRHVAELRSAAVVADHFGVPWECADLSALRPILGGSSQTDEIAVPHGHYTAESMRTTIVPNRNMILLAVAGARAMSLGASSVAYAAHAGDHAIYPDCRPEFVTALDYALLLATDGTVTIERPFITWTKAAICARGAELRVPFGLTYSCYEGHPYQHCGQCGTCVERREAFQLAGVPDPTRYATEGARA